MKVMVMVKGTKESEAGALPDETLLAEMGKYNEELVKAGVLLAAEGLHPSSKGVRVRFSGKDRAVIDGPFAETRELLAGYWLWQVKSMDDAVEWVKRCPNPMKGESEIEIRPVFSPEDFAPCDPTGEHRAAEQRLRAESERYQLAPPRFEPKKEMLIAGLNGSYTFETRVEIPSQWAEFAPQIGRVPGQVDGAAYGVCWNYRPGQGFDYLSGVEVGDVSGLPSEFHHVRLPANRYAVFTHDKHVSSIPDTIDAIYKRWLPNSDHQAAEAPCFERYGRSFDPKTGTGGIEIWVPLKS
jgi:predicted transcriptional regulator YdeE